MGLIGHQVPTASGLAPDFTDTSHRHGLRSRPEAEVLPGGGSVSDMVTQ
jgi:hypothetical protein